MLGVDRQRGSRRKVEPGADPGVFGRQAMRFGFKGRNREEVYGWVNQTLRQQVRGVEAERRGAWYGDTGEDDGAEPGADDASDHGSTWEGRR